MLTAQKMKAITCIVLFLLTAVVAAQEEQKWQRIYTGDEALIEVDTSNVVFAEYGVFTKVDFASARIGRVSVRTIYSKPQALREDKLVRHQKRLETIEFDCGRSRPAGELKIYPARDVVRRYRILKTVLLDSKDKPVKEIETTASEDWRTIKFGTMMDRLSEPACKLIDEKKRHP